METTTNAAITVQSLVKGSVEKVWKHWIGAEHITQWCAPSDDWHAPKATNDARTGGKFSTTMAAKDGSMSFDFAGVYTRVVTNELIEYSIEDGRKVKITFEAKGADTLVTETFDPENMNPIEMQRGGWQAILDNFKKYSETNA